MNAVVATHDTRGDARPGAIMPISAKKIKTHIDAIDYFNRHVPWTTGERRQPDSRACVRIRETLPMVEATVGDSKRRIIRAMRGRYMQAIEQVNEVELLSHRVERLERLKNMLNGMGKLEITGKAAEVVARLLADSEALVCKKIGTAYLRLYSEKYEYACMCLARKNLGNARRIWGKLDPGGIDYAKTLYWLGLANYIDGKFEEANENSLECLRAAHGKPERAWLADKAQILHRDAKIELSQDYLSR